jgi:hypothetical protein
MAEDPTRGLENNAVHGRTIYLNLLRPLPTPLLLKEYEAFAKAFIEQSPKDFVEAFAKLVKESGRKTPEA